MPQFRFYPSQLVVRVVQKNEDNQFPISRIPGPLSSLAARWRVTEKIFFTMCRGKSFESLATVGVPSVMVY